MYIMGGEAVRYGYKKYFVSRRKFSGFQDLIKRVSLEIIVTTVLR
jgi:hypothetical protein